MPWSCIISYREVPLDRWVPGVCCNPMTMMMPKRTPEHLGCNTQSKVGRRRLRVLPVSDVGTRCIYITYHTAVHIYMTYRTGSTYLHVHSAGHVASAPPLRQVHQPVDKAGRAHATPRLARQSEVANRAAPASCKLAVAEGPVRAGRGRRCSSRICAALTTRSALHLCRTASQPVR